MMLSGQTSLRRDQTPSARSLGRSALRLRTGIRAGADDSCLPCANCMYDCAAAQKEDCVKKCAQECGYSSAGQPG